MGLFASSCGHLVQIAGNTFSSMKVLMTSLVMQVMGITSIVPARCITLFLLTCLYVTKGKHRTFPSKMQTPFLNLGLAVTVKTQVPQHCHFLQKKHWHCHGTKICFVKNTTARQEQGVEYTLTNFIFWLGTSLM
jgi:hypothetical protein